MSEFSLILIIFKFKVSHPLMIICQCKATNNREKNPCLTILGSERWNAFGRIIIIMQATFQLISVIFLLSPPRIVCYTAIIIQSTNKAASWAFCVLGIFFVCCCWMDDNCSKGSKLMLNFIFFSLPTRAYTRLEI